MLDLAAELQRPEPANLLKGHPSADIFPCLLASQDTSFKIKPRFRTAVQECRRARAVSHRVQGEPVVRFQAILKIDRKTCLGRVSCLWRLIGRLARWSPKPSDAEENTFHLEFMCPSVDRSRTSPHIESLYVDQIEDMLLWKCIYIEWTNVFGGSREKSGTTDPILPA
jgi:hypothetical protein